MTDNSQQLEKTKYHQHHQPVIILRFLIIRNGLFFSAFIKDSQLKPVLLKNHLFLVTFSTLDSEELHLL